MNFKEIIILMVILTCVTLTAVSASEDVDNNLTVGDDEMAIGEINENITSQSIEDTVSTNDSAKDVSKDDFFISIVHELSIGDDDWYTPQFVISDFPKDGTLKVFVDNKLKFSKNINAKNGDHVYLFIDDIKDKLGINTVGKDYHISIKYAMADKELELENCYFMFYDEDLIRINEYFGVDDKNCIITVIRDPAEQYLIGTLQVLVDGKKVYSKKFKASDKIRFFDVTSSHIGNNYKIKNHKVKIIFKNSKGKTYTATRTVRFLSTLPFTEYVDKIAVGENQSITVHAAKKATGTVTVYTAVTNEIDEDYIIWVKDNKISEIKIVNGQAKFPLSNLPKGQYKFIVVTKIGTYTDEIHAVIDVVENSEGFSASMSSSEVTYGDVFNVKLKGPKMAKLAYFYVDNEYYASVSLKAGSITQKLLVLSVGKHSVRVVFDHGKKYFSKTFGVVVKKSNVKIILKKVKVKKSLKKLKLTATVKIKGKAVKNKMVIFKFNKKTFKVKTNKRGVAKLTVTKKYLKKLKVGKKINYQVTYKYITAKRTAKVLR